MLLAVGFEEALLGTGITYNNEVAVYDYAKCIDILMQRESWTEEEAVEWMEYNVVSAYVGEQTPVFVIIGDMPNAD